VSYRPYLESGALRQMRGLPEEAFGMLVTLLARICDDPYDPDAQAQHDETGAVSATALAAQLAAERQRLEAGNTRYEQWAADTRAAREVAGKAHVEL